MLPPDQCFDGQDLAGAQIDLGLVMQTEREPFSMLSCRCSSMSLRNWLSSDIRSENRETLLPPSALAANSA